MHVSAVNLYIFEYSTLNYTIDNKYTLIFQGVGNSLKEYKKCISVYSIRNQVRYKTNLGNTIVTIIQSIMVLVCLSYLFYSSENSC